MKTIKKTFTDFFHLESASSIILIFSAAVAIVLANSTLSEEYFSMLNWEFTISFGNFSLSKPIILWVNDGLMAIFFFVIGLEIKRELLAGELKSWKRSSLPVMAAIGGMILPITLFFALESDSYGQRGWGIPMATDIAFSLGILTLIGSRVPLSLKIFLTAFAIIDDLGAVTIIALFYSEGILWNYILIAMVIYGILVILTFTNVRIKSLYILTGLVFWYLFLKSGIHPTIAGVMMAFVIPVRRRIGSHSFTQELQIIVTSLKEADHPGMFLNYNQLVALDRTRSLIDNVQPYLQVLERRLHGLVAFFIMPVFALTNAGVQFSSGNGLEINSVAWSVATALLVGKVIGITLFSYLAVRFKIAHLPKNVNMKHIFGVSFLGAVGFTMSLFINSLAYTENIYLNSAKFGIIGASVIAGIIGYLLLKKTLK